MYDESRVKAILQKAIELEAAKASTLTRHEIVQMASEIGVSPSSVDEAILELDKVPPASVQLEPQRWSSLRLLNVSGGLGIACGVLTSGVVISPFTGMLIATTGVWGALSMVSGGLALANGGRSVLNFVRRNTAVWLGFGFGWTIWIQAVAKYGLLPTSHFAIDPIRVALVRSVVALSITTLAGLTYLALKRVRQTTTSDTPSEGSWFRNTVARASRWIKSRLTTPLSFELSVRGLGWNRRV